MLEDIELNSNYKYLDPACGSGGFLIRLFDKMIETKKYDKKSAIDSIFGIDINPFATQLTKMNLFLRSTCAKDGKSVKGINIRNIVTGDTLAKKIKASYIKKNSQKKEHNGYPFSNNFLSYTNFHFKNIRDIARDNFYDVVIGNPPYISLGAWKSAQIDKDYSEDLQDFFTEFYPESAQYKISTYSVFLDKSISLVKPNGVIKLIIPDSFLAGKYFSNLRKKILSYTNIQEILLCQEDFWEDAQVGFPIIIKLKKVDDLRVVNMRIRYFEIKEEVSDLEKKLAKLKSENKIIELSDILEKKE
jgi:type I restriction-modification system DNA methylase subunit